MPESQFSISWKAPDFEYREKTAAWYWASMAAALILVAVSVWQKNYFFGLFVVIAEVLVMVWAERAPHEFECTITEKGLTIGEKFYSMREMEAWSVHETLSDLIHFIFIFKNKYRPAMRVLIPKSHAHDVEEALKLVLKETDPDHSLVDILGDYLGF